MGSRKQRRLKVKEVNLKLKKLKNGWKANQNCVRIYNKDNMTFTNTEILTSECNPKACLIRLIKILHFSQDESRRGKKH